FFFFFFSSRRRHTRFSRDWSSDVCSSDLFDSLITISKLSPKDSSFKIFTWQLVINDNLVRQHGAIQMKTNDGSLKLFPLIDKSRSEERRVGKECRSRLMRCHYNKRI